MTAAIPRLRVFAGPNGSGKSTLKDRLPPEWLGVYVNADEINVSRVQHRVATGGHPVPIDKIISRYERSLGLLSAAVACTDRAYVFDNSSDQRVWVAEVTGGVELQMRSDSMPQWFKTALWDEFEAN
jgi:predicted ABC-type ATPase